MKLLRERVQSRLALHKQFTSLGTRSIHDITAHEQGEKTTDTTIFVLLSSEHSIIPVASECQNLFPAKIISRLAHWTTITHQEYTVHAPHVQTLYVESPAAPASTPFLLPARISRSLVM